MEITEVLIGKALISYGISMLENSDFEKDVKPFVKDFDLISYKLNKFLLNKYPELDNPELKEKISNEIYHFLERF